MRLKTRGFEEEGESENSNEDPKDTYPNSRNKEFCRPIIMS